MRQSNYLAVFTGTSESSIPRERRFQLDVKLHAAKVLTPQLEDPRRPQCCPLCFSQYAHLLTLPPHQSALTELLDCEHGFFGACAMALATPLTSDDLEALRHLLRTNIPTCGTKNWHAYLPPRSDDVLYLFVSALYRCLESPFHGGRRPLKPGSTFSKSRKGVWPLSLDDLLPCGVEASIAAHVFWWTTCLTPSVYPFLNMILDIARPSVLPHLLADSQRIRLVETVLELLTSTCAALPHGRSFSEWTASQRTQAPRIATEFINTLTTGPDSCTGEFNRFCSGYELALFEAITAIWDDGDARAALEPLRRMLLINLALSFHGRLELPDSELHAEFLAFRDFVHPPGVAEQQFASGARMTHFLIIARRKLRACAGPGCTTAAATASREGAGKLQACSRCRLFRYCGRGCQQADWKGGIGHVAHKKLCPVLCRLDAGGALQDDLSPTAYAELYDRVAVTKDELDILVLWARTSKLIPEAMTTRFVKE